MAREATRASEPFGKQVGAAGVLDLPVYSAVYFIAAPRLKLVKIGFAADFNKRLRDLQTGSPVELKLLGVLWDRTSRTEVRERALHEKFARYRERGEWFRLVEPIEMWIADWCAPFNFNHVEEIDDTFDDDTVDARPMGPVLV